MQNPEVIGTPPFVGEENESDTASSNPLETNYAASPTEDEKLNAALKESSDEAKTAVKDSKMSRVAHQIMLSPLLKIISLMSVAIILLILLTSFFAIGSIFIWAKSPDEIILKQDNSGVVELIVNGKSFGEITKPSFKAPGESEELKIYLAKEFARMAYNVVPETRVEMLNKLVNWFPKENNISQKVAASIIEIKNDPNACMPTSLEISQGWFAKTDIQEVKIDPNNPSLVNLLVLQRVQRRLVSNQVENRQLSLQIEFSYIGIPTDENFRTGYVPTNISCRVLPSPTAAENNNTGIDPNNYRSPQQRNPSTANQPPTSTQPQTPAAAQPSGNNPSSAPLNQ